MNYTKTLEQAIKEAKKQLKKKYRTEEVCLLALKIWHDSKVK